MLSAVAGMVDVIGFLSLSLFTAHVTGNLVVIAALLVRGGPPNITQILAVPVFLVAVAAVWVVAKGSHRRGPALARPLLFVQFLLLTCVLIFSVAYDPAAKPRGLMAGVTAMIAVSAMACQFALLRLAVPRAPSTAVMTGNLTNTVLSLLDTLSRSQPLMEGAKERLKKTLELVIGFFAGCIAGAAAFSWLGAWAWSLPVALAGMAVALVTERRDSSG
ncbi:MAG TPA: YoaK family protein [Candidatus Acidoferrales bacterium]|nr:YoaK family protein [Candidatus Acidoferrales bacterium]